MRLGAGRDEVLGAKTKRTAPNFPRVVAEDDIRRRHSLFRTSSARLSRTSFLESLKRFAGLEPPREEHRGGA